MSIETVTTAAPVPSSGAERLFLAFARRLQRGQVTIILPSKTELHFAGKGPGPHAILRIHSPRFYRRILSGGDLGFAEALMDGDCSTDDAVALVELAAVNEEALDDLMYGRHWLRWLARLAHRLRPNSSRGAKRNIAHHYDLGNDFYRLWLDGSMNYSAGLFDDVSPEQPVEAQLLASQTAKYRRMAELAGLSPGDRVLEIGCGWGGFATWAAREIGCHVTAITISPSQHRYATELVAREGLDDRVAVRLQDYRAVSEQFDKIVSIEMLEAVGENYWPDYFDTLTRSLQRGGRAALQVITIADKHFDGYRNNVDFIQKYIFPGGMLPSPSVLQQQAAQAGLRMGEQDFCGLSYAKTLAIWRQHFQEAWPRIQPMGFDERFRRMWQYYFDYCQAGFKVGRINLLQCALEKP